MFESARIVFFYAETPLHAGTGTSLGVVDLPIQRESHTGLPMVQASGVKGAFRELAEGLQKGGKLNGLTVDQIFGPEDGNKHAGALSFTDVRLLLFPVRSLKGIFVWATCPMVLERFARDAGRLGIGDFPIDDIPSVNSDSLAYVSKEPACVAILKNDRLILEDFSFEAKREEAVSEIADWLKKHAFPAGPEYGPLADGLASRLVVLSDTVFSDYTRLGTQVVARIKIDDGTGTVARGGLWYEEALPPESLLYSLALATSPRNGGKESAEQVLKVITDTFLKDSTRIQFGGDATVGRGYVNVRVLSPENAGTRGAELAAKGGPKR